MTEAELLQDLADRADVAWVSDMVKEVADKGEHTGGHLAKLCSVEYAQVANQTGGFALCEFYVLNRGEQNETAYYKDAPPRPRARPDDLEQWIIGLKEANPENFKGLTVIAKSERWEQIIYSVLTGTPLVAKYYYVKKASPPVPVEITGTEDEKRLYIESLMANLVRI